MAEYIENVVLSTSKLDWAFPFQRTGSFPLDRSSMFSSYEDAVLYASGGADSRGLSGSSYAGQPVSVYDAEKGTIDLYIIDYDRSLKAVGSAPVVDDGSISMVDGKLQLKDFGTQYYAFIPAVEDGEGNTIQLSSYELTEGFKDGLEPRVKAKNVDGKIVYEIAWYEPSSETLDGLAAQLETLSNAVENKADASSVYTKTETDALIAAANHLKYKKVNSLTEIDLSVEDADQYIYLVLVDTSIEGDDKYDEYMVIDNALEKVGSWEANLDDYALKTDLNNKVDKVDNKSLVSDSEIEKLATVDYNAQENYVKSVSDKFTVSDVGKLELNSLEIADVNGLSDALNEKLEESDLQTWVATNRDAVDGLFGTAHSNKLEGIEEGAQKNIFDQVNSDQFEIVEADNGAKQLNLKEIAISQITNLEDALNGKASQEAFEQLETNVGTLSTALAGMSDTITTLSGTIDGHTADIGNLSDSYSTLSNTVGTLSNSFDGLNDRVVNLESALNDPKNYITREEYDADMDVVM